LLSPRRAIDCLIDLHELRSDALGTNRSVNLPGVSVSVAQMVDALRAVGGEAPAARIRWELNAAIERIVGSWPSQWDVTRATALGLAGDPSFEAIGRAYIEDDLRTTTA
jgi:hypothetical protein